MAKKQALTLRDALAEWLDAQTTVDGKDILVCDFTGYDAGGMMVKVNGEEDGLHNSYFFISQIESDLAKVVPGYIKGSAVWVEHQEEERW